MASIKELAKNPEWLAAKAIQLARSKTPVPSMYPRDVRVKLDELIAVELKRGEVPSEPQGPIADAVKKAYEIPIKKEGDTRLPQLKPLPPPSQTQTNIADGVPLQRTSFPFRLVSAFVNHFIKKDKNKMDESVERQDLLNQKLQRAYPQVQVSPKVDFWCEVLAWFSGPIVELIEWIRDGGIAKMRTKWDEMTGKKKPDNREGQKSEEVKA